MTTEHLVYFILLSLLAEVVGTVGGFGSSLFFVPIAGYFLDFHSVLGVTALFHVSSNLAKVGLFRHGFDRGLMLRVGIPAVAGVALGAWWSRFFNGDFLELVLAIFLILISVTFLLLKERSVKATTGNAVTGGVLSGVTAGLLGSGGAIRGLTLAAFRVEKSVFIATSAAIDLAVDLSRSVVYMYNGYVHLHDAYLLVILFAVSIAGTFAGKRLLGFFSEAQFRRLVLGLIFMIGLVTLARQVFRLASSSAGA